MSVSPIFITATGTGVGKTVVSSVILARNREYEYDHAQVRMLSEIASLMEWIMREKLITSCNMTDPQCAQYYPSALSNLQHIVTDMIRKDPIGAYVEIIREIRRIKYKMKF